MLDAKGSHAPVIFLYAWPHCCFVIYLLIHSDTRSPLRKKKDACVPRIKNVQRMFPPEKALKRKLIWNHVTATLEAEAGNASWHIDEKNSFNALSWILRHCHRIHIFLQACDSHVQKSRHHSKAYPSWWPRQKLARLDQALVAHIESFLENAY